MNETSKRYWQLPLDLPSVKPSAIALGTIFSHTTELAVMTPLFGQTYQRAKSSSSKEEFARSKEATSAAVAWSSSLVGSALQSYGIGALINATGTLSYKGAAYLGGLVFAATNAPGVCVDSLSPQWPFIANMSLTSPPPQVLSQLFIEKQSLEQVGVNVLAKLLETVGLSVFLTWWGTRTNPFE
jgi:Protein of unknown function (DUF1761)